MNPTFETYEKLDAAILEAIGDGKIHFHRINSGDVEALAKPHSLRGDSFRVVDRRLQSLRKRGLISFANKEWRLV